MTRNMKKTVYVLVLLSLVAGAFGCATAPSVGVGYNVPLTPHDKAGYGFGIGF